MSKLQRQIVDSKLFVVLGTKNYLRCLKTGEDSVSYQVAIAGKYNKPVLLIVDKDMPNGDVIELENYFRAHNVVKEMIVDLNKSDSHKEVATEIRTLAEAEIRTLAEAGKANKNEKRDKNKEMKRSERSDI